MSRRIVLVRHASSAHVHAGWIDSSGFRAWRQAYEAAGIREGERAPAELVALARRADLIVASDAPRAIETARLLAPDREIAVLPFFRELDLDGPNLGRLRLPLAGWAVAVGARILVRTLRRQPISEGEVARIEAAACWLEERTAERSLILAVTHASFRGRLAGRLIENRWSPVPGRRSLRPWSAWEFER